MRAGRIFVTGLVIFSVFGTACSIKAVDKALRESNEKEKLEKEGKNRITTAENEISSLNSTYGIDLDNIFTPSSIFNPTTWGKYNDTELNTIRIRLTNHVANVNRIIEIDNHKDVILFIPYRVKSSRDMANKMLYSLSEHQKSLAKSKADTAAEAAKKARAEKLAEEGNALITKIDASMKDLSETHGVSLYITNVQGGSAIDWSTKTEVEQAVIRTKLLNHVTMVNRLTEINNSPDVMTIGAISARNSLSKAEGYLKSLKEHQNSKKAEFKNRKFNT